MPSPRAVLFRLHWALGLTAGLVLAVMGATGALLSYEEAVTDWLNADRLTLAATEAQPLPLSALNRAVEERMPGQRVGRLLVRSDPGASVIVQFARDPVTKSRPVSVYADPYDGTVLGPVRGEQTFETILALHRFLLLPGGGNGWGRTITGACAMALLVFLATGLVLRWPQIHRWRIWLKPSLSRPGRARWWSLHAVAGTWLLPVYGVIALSGLTWSYGWYKDGVTLLLVGSPPGAGTPPRMARRDRAPAEGTVALDAAWNTFRTGEGQHAVRAHILLPEGRQPIRIRWFSRDDDRPAARNESVYEPGTGTVLTTERASDRTLGQRIAGNMLEVHRGRFFGAPVALVFCLAALAMPGFAATGLVLYVLRRRAAGRRATARSLTPAAAE